MKYELPTLDLEAFKPPSIDFELPEINLDSWPRLELDSFELELKDPLEGLEIKGLELPEIKSVLEGLKMDPSL